MELRNIYNIKIHNIFYMVMIFNLISEKTISRIKDIDVPYLLAVECLIMLRKFIKLLNTQIIVQ